MYLTQKTAAIKPMSLEITKAVSGAGTDRAENMIKRLVTQGNFAITQSRLNRSTWYKVGVGETDI